MGAATAIHTTLLAFLQAATAAWSPAPRVVGVIAEERFSQAELPLICVSFPMLSDDNGFCNARMRTYGVDILVYTASPPREDGIRAGLAQMTELSARIVDTLDTGAWAPPAVAPVVEDPEDGDPDPPVPAPVVLTACVLNRLARYTHAEPVPAGNNLIRGVVSVTVPAIE